MLYNHVLGTVELASSSNSSGTSTNLSADIEFVAPLPRILKGKKFLFSDRLLASLDKFKISNRAGFHIIAAVAHSLGSNIEDYTINYRSLLLSREKYRALLAECRENDFHVNNTEKKLIQHVDQQFFL